MRFTEIAIIICTIFVCLLAVRVGRLKDENSKLKAEINKMTNQEEFIKEVVANKEEMLKKQVFGQNNDDIVLPSTFPLFRVMIELQPNKAMTEEEITDEISNILSLIKSSPSCERIDALMLAGACDDGDNLVFRILKSNATNEKGE